MTETDYKPDDPPVPVGSVVHYFGSWGDGQYEVDEHRTPLLPYADAASHYPDGVAYVLFPVGKRRTFGNVRDMSVVNVRRRSFRVVTRAEETE